MKIFFKNAYSSSEILNIKPDGANVVSVNFYNTICFNRYSDIPNSLRCAIELSATKKVDVLLHAKLDMEGDNVLSTVFLHNGVIAGVSDSITNNMFTTGNALRMYKIGGVWSGLCVDKDMLYSGVDNFFYGGAKIVFHNSLNDFDKEYFKAYRSHCRLCQGIRVGLFRDGAVVCDETIKGVGDFAEINPIADNLCVHRAFLRLSKGE